MEVVGRAALLAGLALVAVGLVLLLMGRMGWTPRSLPGDLVIRRPGVVVYIPLASMLLISLLGTLVLWLLNWLRR
ncbi:MAG: DUF2905 domain-containing protein [Armatimonadetes bacterium]|nr:DUF2905 domain-containing protein [Armatimonadota bacterium]